MANRDPVPFTTPVGRMVWGSVHKAQPKTDSNNQPKIGKDGSPMETFDFGVAIPKTQPTWQQEPWGATIHAEGLASWPGGQTQRHDFAWKVVDGDSAIPNKRGKVPNQQEGYAGHWVLSFSSMFAPALCINEGHATMPLPVGVQIVPGDYVQVGASVVSNNSTQTAGVYLNHQAVCLRVKGTPIVSKAGPDVASFGFGGAPVPTGAATAATTPPVAVPQAAAPVPTPVAPLPPSIPPIPAGPRMTGKDGQTDYNAMKSAGWTDDMMRQHGYLE